MTNRNEVWKIVKDSPNYAVSSSGRVKRITANNGTAPGRILKPLIHKNGYIRVSIDGKFRWVHRLVLQAFTEVHHKNGDPSDNRLENLEWMTKLGHMQKHLPYSRCKFSAEDVKTIRSSSKTQTRLAKEFNCSQTMIGFIKAKKFYKWVE